ncbi:MAG TPA: Uma2 family endonuclease [Longimicrobiales bacterium]
MATYEAGPRERLLSAEEFEQLYDDTEDRLELVRGRVIREPPPGLRHAQIDSRLAARLRFHAEAHRLGEVFCNASFLLVADPPTVRGPDISFVAAERLPPDGVPPGLGRLAPDLAVEVLSPWDRASELQEKVLEYLDVGVRLVWVVDPARRSVTVYRSRSDIRLLTGQDVLDGDDLLPGFSLSLPDLFAP